MPSIFIVFLLYFEEWMNFYPSPCVECVLLGYLGLENFWYIAIVVSLSEQLCAKLSLVTKMNDPHTFFFLTIETKVTNNNITRFFILFLWNIILLLSWLIATLTLRENSLNYISTLPIQFATGFIMDLAMSCGKMKGAQYFNLEVVGSRSHYRLEKKKKKTVYEH